MRLKTFTHMIVVGVLALAVAASYAAAADLEQGEEVFEKCKICHSLGERRGMVGPSLHGVVGRQAGQLPGYDYSRHLRTSGIVWTEDNIDRFLTDPKGFIPGIKMMFPGLKKRSDRNNLIAFLKASSS